MSPFRIYRSDQQWNRCPVCLKYYVYEGEMPDGRVVHEQRTNPYPCKIEHGEAAPKDAFFKRVIYSACPSCRVSSKRPKATRPKDPLPEVSDLEGLT